ncbi:hypothetical protein PG990_014781 [Apiospora arundinis]|uniref:Uncharacterized protein n=1 Tax=Apiospora arundinis TaxID=335852 RepID=A0ABR2HK52_9PEZI
MSYSTQSISSWVTSSPIIGPIAANVIHAKFSGKVLSIGVGRVQTVCRPAFAPKSPAILPITRLRASESLTKTSYGSPDMGWNSGSNRILPTTREVQAYCPAQTVGEL